MDIAGRVGVRQWERALQPVTVVRFTRCHENGANVFQGTRLIDSQATGANRSTQFRISSSGRWKLNRLGKMGL